MGRYILRFRIDGSGRVWTRFVDAEQKAEPSARLCEKGWALSVATGLAAVVGSFASGQGGSLSAVLPAVGVAGRVAERAKAQKKSGPGR